MSPVKENLRLYKSTIEDRIEYLKPSYSNTHETFLRLIFYLVTGHSYDDLEPEDIIDGHGEYQIDALHIDTGNSEEFVTVTLIQVTYSNSLSSTKLIKMHAGLDYLLRQPKNIYTRLTNSALKDKIQEFRDIRTEYLPNNVRLQCFYASLGDPENSHGEFPEQVERIKSDYKSDVGDFDFKVLGPAEIYELMILREERSISVNDRMRIIYDQNKANIVEHSIEDVSGIICMVDAYELARIVRTYPTVFDDNLRRFLGSRGSVNDAIKKSCSSTEDAPLFWFLNNGITIVCDSFDVHKDFDNPFIELRKLRIVNGCQTASTISRCFEEGTLRPETRLMVRVFKTQSPDLISKLVITTNTQNKISSRDLHSQDEIQSYIKLEFERKFGILFERTPNEFVVPKKEGEVIVNQKMGQAFLAIVLKKPGDANRRQYKIWSNYYDQVFNADTFIETYLLAYRIVNYCSERKRQILSIVDTTDIRRVLLANGTYHLARMVSFMWRHGDNWSDLLEIRQDIERLKDNPNLLEAYHQEAIEILVSIFAKNTNFSQDPSVALKSSDLENIIEKNLYTHLASL